MLSNSVYEIRDDRGMSVSIIYCHSIRRKSDTVFLVHRESANNESGNYAAELNLSKGFTVVKIKGREIETI